MTPSASRNSAATKCQFNLFESKSGFRQTTRVKLTKFFAILLLPALLIGCKKAEPAAPASDQPIMPTQAQPMLPTMKIYLGAETLDAELATTPQEETTGLMFRTNITDQTAMLFVFPQPYQASFWMKNCPISISAAYIDPSGVIEEIHHLEKNDTNAVVAASANIQYVLEVNDGWFARHNINTGMVVQTEKGTLSQTFFGK